MRQKRENRLLRLAGGTLINISRPFKIVYATKQPGVGTSLSSHTGMCASFGVVFGTKILGMGYAFCRNFLGLGLIFTRNSGNGQV